MNCHTEIRCSKPASIAGHAHTQRLLLAASLALSFALWVLPPACPAEEGGANPGNGVEFQANTLVLEDYNSPVTQSHPTKAYVYDSGDATEDTKTLYAFSKYSDNTADVRFWLESPDSGDYAWTLGCTAQIVGEF
jgi:hypothetical protein